MADTGEGREIKARLEAKEKERFEESQQVARKTTEGNRRRTPKLKPAVDPHLYPPGSISVLPERS